MIVRKATCHCGNLTLVCEGEPAKISMCHCTDCQRRTGSAFSIAAFYPREKVTVSGKKLGRWERQSVSGFPVAFHFCGRCGSSVFWEPARMPDRIGVAVGAFADPNFPVPQQSVSMADKHSWVRLPEEVICFDGFPPRPVIEAT